MTRLLRPLLILVFLALGAGIGALNAAPVQVDLGALRFEAALGLVLLATLLAGVLLGGLALTVSVVLPMRRRWRRECDALRAAQAGQAPVSADIAVRTGPVASGSGMPQPAASRPPTPQSGVSPSGTFPSGKSDGIPY